MKFILFSQAADKYLTNAFLNWTPLYRLEIAGICSTTRWSPDLQLQGACLILTTRDGQGTSVEVLHVGHLSCKLLFHRLGKIYKRHHQHFSFCHESKHHSLHMTSHRSHNLISIMSSQNHVKRSCRSHGMMSCRSHDDISITSCQNVMSKTRCHVEVMMLFSLSHDKSMSKRQIEAMMSWQSHDVISIMSCQSHVKMSRRIHDVMSKSWCHVEAIFPLCHAKATSNIVPKSCQTSCQSHVKCHAKVMFSAFRLHLKYS